MLLQYIDNRKLYKDKHVLINKFILQNLVWGGSNFFFVIFFFFLLFQKVWMSAVYRWYYNIYMGVYNCSQYWFLASDEHVTFMFSRIEKLNFDIWVTFRDTVFPFAMEMFTILMLWHYAAAVFPFNYIKLKRIICIV